MFAARAQAAAPGKQRIRSVTMQDAQIVSEPFFRIGIEIVVLCSCRVETECEPDASLDNLLL
ncbi:MAG: hypothetical protein N838_32830 [Thiohalocapsa sp. PB-PSB1]|jgi:hypothetical protein|nr:MAG: hypothetical protein N838_32830 [Thiohalocapsa sp. PB-PSB1]